MCSAEKGSLVAMAVAESMSGNSPHSSYTHGRTTGIISLQEDQMTILDLQTSPR